MRLGIISIVFTLLASVGCVTKGTDKSFDAKDISGTWIGEDIAHGDRYEIRINDQLTGLMAVAFYDQEPVIWIIREGVKDPSQNSFILRLQHLPSYRERKADIEVIFRPFTGGINMEFVDDRGKQYNIYLFREAFVEEQKRRLKHAIDAIGVQTNSAVGKGVR